MQINQTMKKLPVSLLDRSFSFEAYQALFGAVLAGKPTAYTEKQASFLALNAKRMARLLKKDRLLAEANARVAPIDQPLHLLVITEPWCGDAAQVIPPVVQLAAQNEYIELSFVLRDEEPELIDAFLTNGSRAIPKVLFLDPEHSYTVLGSWGPRPVGAQEMMTKGLSKWQQMPDGSAREQFYADLYAELQKWYMQDKTKSTQRELLQALEASLENKATLV